MNTEQKALAEYLDARFNKVLERSLNGIKRQINNLEKRFDQGDTNFISIEANFQRVHQQLSVAELDLKWVHTRINNLIEHIDSKNDEQDMTTNEMLTDHDMRISTLESDFRVLTS